MVTPAHIQQLSDDFNKISEDILAVVPHNPRVDRVLMIVEMAEAAAVSLLTQELRKQGQTP